MHRSVLHLVRLLAPAAVLGAAALPLAAQGVPAPDTLFLGRGATLRMMSDRIAPGIRPHITSLDVELGPNRLGAVAVVATAELASPLLGAMAVMLGSQERVRLAGPVSVVAPGRAVWTVDEMVVGRIPIPRAMIPTVVARALPGATEASIPVGLPPWVRRVRVDSTGVTLFSRPT